MTPAQQRAMSIGRELDTLNEILARRADILACGVWYQPRHGAGAGNRTVVATAYNHPFTPAAHAGYLMGTARMHARRRALRDLLADQLEASAR